MKLISIQAACALTLVVLAGCPGGGGAPDANCQLAIEWGHGRDASFVAFGAGDNAEITLGFQGFRYIDSSLEVVGASGSIGEVWFQIEVDGMEPSASRQHVSIPEGEGARYVEDVLVFFNDTPIAELVGRTTLITIRLESGGCDAIDAVSVTLVDEEQCVEQDDGSLVCE